MSSFFDKLGDMFVPKEIAPYLGMIAPMVAPQLGIFGSMALSQLGSFKQHGGKFDPFSAVATGIALASPQARAIRAAGRAGGQEQLDKHYQKVFQQVYLMELFQELLILHKVYLKMHTVIILKVRLWLNFMVTHLIQALRCSHQKKRYKETLIKSMEQKDL